MVYIADDDETKGRAVRVKVCTDKELQIELARVECLVDVMNVKRGDIVRLERTPEPRLLSSMPAFKIVEVVDRLIGD